MNAIETIRGAEQFVAQWYLDQYPDVAATGMDAAVHYCKYGWLLGRDPGPGFSTSDYISKNPVCQEKNINPLLHSILCDVAEPTALSEASRSNGLDNVASRHHRIEAQLHETQKLLECYYSKYQDLEIEKLYGRK
ncbi:hypothetical protein [Salinicola sp. DM10]|uniref:hypothetical protein n=1 Tax=Salinicola sp. DM10 TaxID=2815721 RepID=UPI001A8C5319|nr:hypothetical protein [Salinicola sp. DM10]MCE3026012.1 hypothetical protein [Salinicola sp. DM10]